MTARIFISYSLNQVQVGQLAAVAELLESQGHEVFVPDRAWPHDRMPKRIRDWLMRANFVLVIATDQSSYINWVNKEIEYAVMLKRPLIAVSDSGTVQSWALNSGLPFVYMAENPYETITNLSNEISKIQASQLQLKDLLIPAGLLLAIFFLLSSRGTK